MYWVFMSVVVICITIIILGVLAFVGTRLDS